MPLRLVYDLCRRQLNKSKFAINAPKFSMSIWKCYSSPRGGLGLHTAGLAPAYGIVERICQPRIEFSSESASRVLNFRENLTAAYSIFERI